MAGFFDDLFGGATNAANAQANGQTAGLQGAAQNYELGNQFLTGVTQQAVQPAQQNYNQDLVGTTQLGNLLGLNGQPGVQDANAYLQTMPGYQFAQQAGANQVNASAAANGMTNSGNQQLALQQQGQGIASQNYNNYVSQLQPFMGAQGQAAGQIGGLYGAEAQGINSNYGQLAQTTYGAQSSIGNAYASADLANQKTDASLLGNAISGIASIFSDERLKDDIEPVGELFDGTTVYRYHYKWDDIPRIGVMAQEVEQRNPDAVTEIGGFKAVDYGKATDYAAALGQVDAEPANDRGDATDYAAEFGRLLEAA